MCWAGVCPPPNGHHFVFCDSTKPFSSQSFLCGNITFSSFFIVFSVNFAVLENGVLISIGRRKTKFSCTSIILLTTLQRRQPRRYLLGRKRLSFMSKCETYSRPKLIYSSVTHPHIHPHWLGNAYTKFFLVLLMFQGENLCEDCYHQLAVQSVDVCLSEDHSSRSVTQLVALRENLSGIDEDDMRKLSAEMPSSTNVGKRVDTFVKRRTELDQLLSARIDGIRKMSMKHSALKEQLQHVSG